MQIEKEMPSMVRIWRIWALMAIFLLGVTLLIWRLWNVQVRDSIRYGRAQSNQSLRLVEQPGLRGRIYDRNGILLADNRPAYAVAIYCEDIQQPGIWSNTILAVDALIDQLAQRLGLPRQISREAVVRHIHESRPIPLIIWQDVDFRTVAYLSEWAEELPGVEIIPIPRRIYPMGSMAAHVLGYVGFGGTTRGNQEPRRWNFRLPNPHGKSGIEWFYDHILAGKSGEEVLLVDSRVYTRNRWIRRKAEPGNDLTLTLDVPLQRVAEAALANRPGAIVALDPRSGDILAMASAPTYNPNAFIPSITKSAWETLLNDPQKPFFNRAIQGQYAPGSVFKPFVALAAQEQGFDPNLLYECTGVYTDYRCHLRCSNRYGHGELDMRQALMKSCNPYFCHMGTTIGINAILATAQQAGFGTRTGLDLPDEKTGFMPTPEWKRTHFKTPWLPSDTAQCAIGQGAILTTPLQIAHAIGILAAGGSAYRPRLVALGATGELVRQLPWPENIRKPVIQGMEMAVLSGTGQTMQVEGIRVAGKTGTAEYQNNGVREKHVWSVAFAPVEHPQIVVCAMLDNGIGGGRDAGPIVQKVLAAYFNKSAIKRPFDEESLED